MAAKCLTESNGLVAEEGANFETVDHREGANP